MATFASKPELVRRAHGALWKEAMVSSRCSAYGVLPSSRREPPEPKGKSGCDESSERYCLRNSDDVERLMKSLLEKSVDPRGVSVSRRRMDDCRRLDSELDIATSSAGKVEASLRLPCMMLWPHGLLVCHTLGGVSRCS